MLRYLNPLLDDLHLEPGLVSLVGQLVATAFVTKLWMPSVSKAFSWWIDPIDGRDVTTSIKGAIVVVAIYAIEIGFFWLLPGLTPGANRFPWSAARSNSRKTSVGSPVDSTDPLGSCRGQFGSSEVRIARIWLSGKVFLLGSPPVGTHHRGWSRSQQSSTVLFPATVMVGEHRGRIAAFPSELSAHERAGNLTGQIGPLNEHR